MKFRRKIGLPLFLVLLSGAFHAQADSIWKCVDGEGHVQFQNTKPAVEKGCKLIAQDKQVNIMAAPKPRAASTPSPQNFPKVNGETQRGRDLTRRQILEQEMSEEQKQMEKAQTALAEQEAIRNGDERNYQRVLDRLKPFQDRVAEHQRNIEALRQEMGKLK